MVPSHAVIAVVLGFTAAAVAQPQAGLWFVGLAPGTTQGVSLGLSQDGSIAVGYSGGLSGTSGFTWTREGGRFDFGLLPGMPAYTPAFAVSSDGSTLAGRVQFAVSQDIRPYRWAGVGPVQDLGLLPNETRGYALGISGDGSVVVGACEHGPGSQAFGQAFRWTAQGGMQPLGYVHPAGSFSQASGISRDGSTIVGWSQSLGPGGPEDPFIWTQAAGMRALPHPVGAGEPYSQANAVNADGTVIVGTGIVDASNLLHALRWTTAGVQDLGLAPGFLTSDAFAVSDNGLVIGGAANIVAGSVALVWTPQTGMGLLADHLIAAGIGVPSNYRLESVMAVSGDGLTFAGQARNLTNGTLEGYVATVPEPGSALIFLFPAVARRRRR
jgi:uncharacterized membrane protein